MRRKNRHNGGTIIDLTSLLDVIFIVLLVVICYAFSLNESYRESTEENKNSIAELAEEKNTYNAMKEKLGNLTEFVGVIVIRIPYNDDDYTKRTIHIIENGEEEIQKYDIAGNRKIADQSELYQYLEEYINKYDEKPVVLSLNDSSEDILYRDEVEINEIIDKLKSEHENIIHVK